MLISAAFSLSLGDGIGKIGDKINGNRKWTNLEKRREMGLDGRWRTTGNNLNATHEGAHNF